MFFPHTRSFNIHKLQSRSLEYTFLSIVLITRGINAQILPTKFSFLGALYLMKCLIHFLSLLHIQIQSTLSLQSLSFIPTPILSSFLSNLSFHIPIQSKVQTFPYPFFTIFNSQSHTLKFRCEELLLQHDAFPINPISYNKDICIANEQPIVQGFIYRFAKNSHGMTTKSQNIIFKPKIFITSWELDSVEEALAIPHWKTIIQDEYRVLMNNQTQSLAPIPPKRQDIGCKQVFKMEKEFRWDNTKV